jgi:hypothetical protein
MATDGKGGYREAPLARWGQVPEYARRGRPASRKQAHPDWHYLQVIKHGSGHRLISVTISGSFTTWMTCSCCLLVSSLEMSPQDTLAFCQSLRKAVSDKIQSDVMLKQRFEAREHQREPLS